MSLKGLKEHPFLGWGQGNFNLVFNKYYDPKMYKQEPWFDRAHNVIFDRAITTGLIGLLIYLFFIFYPVYFLFKYLIKFYILSQH